MWDPCGRACGKSFKRSLFIPYVYFKRFLPVSNKVTYDIVISSYSLSEIPRIAMRKEAIRNLWAKTNDFLVLIEYGNNEGFEILLEARQLVEKCPHDTSCPRSELDTRDHPCNFEQHVQLAFAEKRTAMKKWGFVTERFSYLVLRKGNRNQADKPWPRILEPVKLRGRHIICKLCSSNGKAADTTNNTAFLYENWPDARDIELKILTKKKDSDIYKCARHVSKWGDLMPMPEDRQRPLNNPHITTTRRGKARK
ncbi:hypothetical protein QZH41_009239 [Actinostola sp. cb2023]|nr:hypothetical protein QZH41_009239 [Actinostola sp. cb2023]